MPRAAQLPHATGQHLRAALPALVVLVSLVTEGRRAQAAQECICRSDLGRDPCLLEQAACESRRGSHKSAVDAYCKYLKTKPDVAPGNRAVYEALATELEAVKLRRRAQAALDRAQGSGASLDPCGAEPLPITKKGWFWAAVAAGSLAAAGALTLAVLGPRYFGAKELRPQQFMLVVSLPLPSP